MDSAAGSSGAGAASAAAWSRYTVTAPDAVLVVESRQAQHDGHLAGPLARRRHIHAEDAGPRRRVRT